MYDIVRNWQQFGNRLETDWQHIGNRLGTDLQQIGNREKKDNIYL